LSTISGKAEIYFGDASDTGLVFKMFASVYTDNGTIVTLDARTKDYMFDPDRKTKYKYMYCKHKTGSAGSLQILARIDQAADFGLQNTIALAGSSPGLGSTGTFTLGTSVLGGSNTNKERTTFASMLGTLLGLQFLEETANSCDIYEYSILGYKKGYRDD